MLSSMASSGVWTPVGLESGSQLSKFAGNLVDTGKGRSQICVRSVGKAQTLDYCWSESASFKGQSWIQNGSSRKHDVGRPTTCSLQLRTRSGKSTDSDKAASVQTLDRSTSYDPWNIQALNSSYHRLFGQHFTDANAVDSRVADAIEDSEAPGRDTTRVENGTAPLVSGLEGGQMVHIAELGPPLGFSEESLYQSWIASQFSATLQSSPPPRQKQESELRDNYYVNVGYAIRTLREELPSMFYKELSYDIYREDIVFRDPLNTFSGMDNYKLIFWALRFHGRIFFKALWVDVVRVWQPNDKVIMVRWSVRGLPRVPWEAQGHFDGTSEYKLDKEGRIYEHKVDNVVMGNQQQFQPLTVMDLVRLAGARTTPTPTFFERVDMFCSLTYPYLSAFTWVRFYWALRGTLTLTEALVLPLLCC